VKLGPMSMSTEAEQAYTKYVVDHHGEIDVTDLAQTMFNAGGRTAVEAMIIFGDIVPQLHRIEARVRRLLEITEAFVPDVRSPEQIDADLRATLGARPRGPREP
jgi:hypothetical protein